MTLSESDIRKALGLPSNKLGYKWYLDEEFAEEMKQIENLREMAKRLKDWNRIQDEVHGLH